MEPETTPQKKSSNKLWIILLLLFLLALAGFAYWYFFMQEASDETAEVTTTKVATESAKPATESSQTANDLNLITAALATKSGTTAEMLSVSVTSNDGKYAKGTVNTKGEEVGGGYFLAVKINNDWVIVHSGQDNPTCSSVNPHNFPTTLAPECLDANGSVVQR